MTEVSTGSFLRELRHQLQLNMRDVQEMSLRVAARQRNKRFYISIARLNKIENDKLVPNQFKIFTLSVIYGVDFLDLLARYGVAPDQIHKFRSQIRTPSTRPVSTEIRSLDTKVTVPIRLDPSFKWQNTQLINRIVSLWGEIPAAFLLECNPRQHMYAYIGLEDETMVPLLMPGSLVMIDHERRHVTKGGWSNEYQRPIYLIELKEGYVCGWCEVDDSRLIVLPYPTSKAPLRTFSLATEAEVIGQVVGVAMRLVRPIPTSPETAVTVPEQS